MLLTNKKPWLAITLIVLGIALIILAGVLLCKHRKVTPTPFVSPLAHVVYLPVVVKDYPQPIEHGIAATYYNLPGMCSRMQQMHTDWYYNWSYRSSLDCQGVEFTPMIWEPSMVGNEIPPDAEWLLGFNECGVYGQCPATPCEAAIGWRNMEQTYPNVKLGSPSFLGWYGYSFLWWIEEWYQCYQTMYGENPRLDALTVHCYGSDTFCQEFLSTAIDFADSIGGIPVWVTEYANPPKEGVSYEQTIASMDVMINWFKDNPRITRWGWFALIYHGDESWLPDFWLTPYSTLVDYDTHELTPCGELYKELGDE